MSASVDYDRIIREVMDQALVPVSGTWSRRISTQHADTSRPWQFSATCPSRFYDEKRQPCLCHLYLAENDEIAQYESRSLFWDGKSEIDESSEKQTLVRYDVTLQHVFDLPSIMPKLFTAQEQTGDWEGYEGRSRSASLANIDCKIPSDDSDPICPTQRFGKAISRIYLEKQCEIDGLLYISAKYPIGRCLMVFIDDADADDHDIPGRLTRL